MSNILNFKSFLNFLGRNKGYTAIDLFWFVRVADVCDPDRDLCGR